MLARSAFAPRRRNSHKADEARRVPGFLQWLRGRDCCIGGQCAGRIEACHVDYAGGKGVGIKVADEFCVPMCAAHHAESHQSGIKTFEARHKVKLLERSKEYWNQWLHRTTMGKRWAERTGQ